MTNGVIVGDWKSSATDEEVLERAEKEERILITDEKGFGELVFRLGRPSRGLFFSEFRQIKVSKPSSDEQDNLPSQRLPMRVGYLSLLMLRSVCFAYTLVLIEFSAIFWFLQTKSRSRVLSRLNFRLRDQFKIYSLQKVTSCISALSTSSKLLTSLTMHAAFSSFCFNVYVSATNSSKEIKRFTIVRFASNLKLFS